MNSAKPTIVKNGSVVSWPVTWLMAAKLLVLAALLPIVSSIVLELNYVIRTTISSEAYVEWRYAPVLYSSALIVVALMCFFFVAYIIATCIPLAGELVFMPILAGAWSAICYASGLVLESLTITPRIFMGSVIERAFKRNSNGRLFSWQLWIVILVLASVTCWVSSRYWNAWYEPHMAEVRGKAKLNYQVCRIWSWENPQIASRELMNLSGVIEKATYLTDSEKRVARELINRAHKLLNDTILKPINKGIRWQTELANILNHPPFDQHSINKKPPD